ncbi:MAG: hypothetical protein ACOC56_04890 [Atribacterota bacterium]
MRVELEEKLVRKFPILYRDYGGSPQKTCMAFGFECGDGWFDLIEDLSEKIIRLDPDAYALCVKEKFGGLRFDVSSSSEEVGQIIHQACRKSFQICEKCGKSGKFRHNGWLRTLCDYCNNKEYE